VHSVGDTRIKEAGMTMRTRTTAAAMVVVAGITAAIAIPALTGAQTSGAREITVRMKVRAGAQVQHRKSTKGDTLATGDAVLVRLAMSSPSGAALGSAYTECVNVGRKAANPVNATLQCVQTYKFKDGQIVIAGVAKFSQLENLSLPIVGGSGAYRGASGFVSAGKPVRGFDSVDILHLDP
jgi:hypothetical protein